MQNEFIFLKIQDPFIPHFAQLTGHGAAVHSQKIRKLLTVEGNLKGRPVLPFYLVRKIGKQFFSGGALRHIGKLPHQISILL